MQPPREGGMHFWEKMENSMKRRIISTVLCAAMVISLTACGSGTPGKDSTASEALKTEAASTSPQTEPDGTKEPETADAQQPEKLMAIVNKEGKRLGAIDADSACSAVDGGVFYSVVEMAEYAQTGTARYYFFRAEDGKNILLGTLEDQGYEAAYTRTELDGVIYTLATVGNAFDDKPDTLYLLAFDTAAETMTKYAVSADGFPYAAMAVSGGKLLIMNHEMNAAKADKVYEFDPASGTVREVLSIPDDGKSSLRSVAGAEEGFYLLRLGLSGGMPEEMFLDRYDSAYQLTDSLSLNGLIIPAMKDLPGMEGEADVLTEFGLAAGGFAVQDGRYLFYENFGRIRVIIDLETGEALFADQDLWSMVHGGGEPAVYEIAFEPYGAGEGPKILSVKDGKLESLPFSPDDSHYFLRAVSCSADGTWLFRMANSAPAGMGEEILYLWK